MLRRYTSIAIRLLADNSAVIFVAILAYFLEDTLSRMAQSQKNTYFDTPLAVLRLILQMPISAIMALVLVGVVVKSVFVLFTNDDVYNALQGKKSLERYREQIRISQIWSYYAAFAAILLSWNAAFFVLGASIILLFDALFASSFLKWFFTLGAAVFLWPIYYSGVSILALLTIMKKNQYVPRRHPVTVIKSNFTKIYVAYALRSILDFGIVLGVPYLILLVLGRSLIGILATVILVGVGLVFFRAAALAFKLDLFR